MCPTHSSAGQLQLELPATPTSITAARHAVAELCAGHALDHEAVALAVSEAVANAVVHAYRDRDPGLVHLSASLKGGALDVVIRDDGTGIAPRPVSPGMGLGLDLIAKLADTLEIEHDDGGTRLIMRFTPGL
jgi:anti-sigma regulatory factor (Ser/Thr protein kinase)